MDRNKLNGFLALVLLVVIALTAQAIFFRLVQP